MADSLVRRIRQKIDEAYGLYCRLILLVKEYWQALERRLKVFILKSSALVSRRPGRSRTTGPSSRVAKKIPEGTPRGSKTSDVVRSGNDEGGGFVMITDVIKWDEHIAIAGPYKWSNNKPPEDLKEHRKHIEPWLAALLQAEHLNLLIGSGLSIAIAKTIGAKGLDMSPPSLSYELSETVEKQAEERAKLSHRGSPNIEDFLAVIVELVGGFDILAKASNSKLSEMVIPLLTEWKKILHETLQDFTHKVFESEQEIKEKLESDSEESRKARRFLGSFLLTFASRVASRERLHIFTTNYDRLIEYGCDMLGLRILDRFVGQLSPVFRSSRLGIDFHYNPPGIRGEPRYLEGVIRFTKLHGSIDWYQEKDSLGRSQIRRYGIPFGGYGKDFDLPPSFKESVIIYPNPAKDVETLEYPYAELFRDFAAAICQPNTVLVTYGYGFGDDHINRIIRDMLTIPSTHLAILSYDTAGDRIRQFCEMIGRNEQSTLLIGNHFGSIEMLVDHYLPKPAIDKATLRMVELINRRTPHKESENGKKDSEQEQHSDSEGRI